MTSTPRFDPALIPDTTRSGRAGAELADSELDAIGRAAVDAPRRRALPPTEMLSQISGRMNVIACAAPL
jgi:hypothetical protein